MQADASPFRVIPCGGPRVVSRVDPRVVPAWIPRGSPGGSGAPVGWMVGTSEVAARGRRRLGPIDADLPLPNPPLRNAAFVLRPFRGDDIVGAEEFAADPASARWVPTLPAADGEGVAASYDEARTAGEMLLLVIADPTTDAYLGEVVLVPGEHRVAELGCGVRPSARGRGLGSAALRLLADWALAPVPEGLGLGRVHVLVAVENDPALGLSERAGFRREAVLGRYWEIDGERLDVVVLARFPGDGP